MAIPISLRHAIRRLAHARTFTAMTLVTLAVGIGANAAIFSLVRGVLLRPLPLLEPERIVSIQESHAEYGPMVASPPNYLDFKSGSRSFQAMGAYGTSSLVLSGAGEAEQLSGAYVTDGFFESLGVRPLHGRILTAAETATPDGKVVLLGHGENSIFDIFQELSLSFPDVDIMPVIADIRDRNRVFHVFQQHRPHAVFHAAAHKHVPLMEDNVLEAVTNNVAGTRNVVDAAIETNVQHFVLVSTDKAVRPTSVMGATKRIAEQIVQHAATKHHRNFVSVRFGNVLGSRGSVVPTFLRQIRAGGPVTVTHPEMRRYFMTIPEAVQLVLQAGALGRGGEVFVLDMGEQIRVVDIATDLIRLSGLEVGADIEIKFTGVRPGEKLYEEMFFTAENVLPTDHPKVLRARNGLLADGTLRRIEALMRSTDSGRPEDEIRKLLQTLVPDFHPHGTKEHEEEIRVGESIRRA